MVRSEDYKIDLFDAHIDGLTREYVADDAFFEMIDGLIQHGSVRTVLSCKGSARGLFHFEIHSEGVVSVPCDRCLADIELRIDTTDELAVKLGQEYADEGDVVVVPENEGTIDMAQFIYEFIALSLPLKRVHEPGKCDAAMMAEIEKHQAARSGEGE